MARISGGRHDIAENDVRLFFDRRAAAAGTLKDGLSATAFTDPATAEERHQIEARIALPLIGLPSPDARVLDVGCGSARWAVTLCADKSLAPAAYVGFDFSASLIALAKSLDLGEHFQFHCNSATEFVDQNAAATAKYSHILAVGVLMYMNDETVHRLLDFCARSLAEDGVIYLREGVMTSAERLTLSSEPSAALADHYTVIYRTAREYDQMISAAGLQSVTSSDLPASHFQRHVDTRHRFFICKKK
jgi:SAM-dependent methyltransferase